MRKKWTGYALAFSLCLSLLVPAGQIKAADANVKVKVPNFEVNLNGHTLENQYREWPLLVYRGITYFPMTLNDTRLLGLESIWSPAAGFSIKQSQVTFLYAPDKSGSRNAATYSAKFTLNNRTSETKSNQISVS